MRQHLKKYWQYHLLFWVVVELSSISELLYGFKKSHMTDLIWLDIIYIGLMTLFSYMHLYIYFKFKKKNTWVLIPLFLMTIPVYVMVNHYTINLVTPIRTLYLSKAVGFVLINIVFFALYFMLDSIEAKSKYQELIIRNRENELAVLTSQINPHFLMNTFNNIYADLALKDKKSGEMILQLSDLLRYSFKSIKLDKVSLKEEITYLRNYIALEKMRLNKAKIDLIIQVPNETVLIAPLLLIPLVENAFKHGLSEVTHSAWLKLDLAVKENVLYFKIENSKPQVKPLTLGFKSGLSNLRKRLNLLYQDCHSLLVENRETSFLATLEISL